jgi:hypothetical protein
MPPRQASGSAADALRAATAWVVTSGTAGDPSGHGDPLHDRPARPAGCRRFTPSGPDAAVPVPLPSSRVVSGKADTGDMVSGGFASACPGSSSGACRPGACRHRRHHSGLRLGSIPAATADTWCRRRRCDHDADRVPRSAFPATAVEARQQDLGRQGQAQQHGWKRSEPSSDTASERRSDTVSRFRRGHAPPVTSPILQARARAAWHRLLVLTRTHPGDRPPATNEEQDGAHLTVVHLEEFADGSLAWSSPDLSEAHRIYCPRR